MALGGDIERLTRVPLFAALNRDALRLVAFAAENRTLRAGDVLFRPGEAAAGAILVTAGAVALGPSTRDVAADAGAGPGTLIAARALLTEARHDTAAIARQTSAVLLIPRVAFLRALAEYPDDAVRLRRDWARALAGRLAALKDAVRT